MPLCIRILINHMKSGMYVLLLCALLGVVQADDITLRSGRILKDATVASSGDDFVSIQYTDGVAKIPYKELTDEQQILYKMTPENVQVRMEKRRMDDAARRKKAEEVKLAADEEARKIRESLSEAERHPRYLKGEDMRRMFLLMGDLSNVEAEVMALQWNALEANRVGLPEDARMFRDQVADYQPQLSAMRKKREEAEQYWKDLEKKYLVLQDGTQKQIKDLNKEVNRLQGEVKDVASQPRTERVIVAPVWRPWNYNPNPPIIINPVPPRPPRPLPPHPVHPIINSPKVSIGR